MMVTDLSTRDLSSDRSSTAIPHDFAMQSCRNSSSGSESASSEQLRTYFRSPRPKSSTVSLLKRSQEFKSEGRLTPESDFKSINQSDPSGSSSPSDSDDTCRNWQMPSPSNPNVDYSFREADLYYAKPRQISFGQSNPEGYKRPGTGNLGEKLRFWSR